MTSVKEGDEGWGLLFKLIRFSPSEMGFPENLPILPDYLKVQRILGKGGFSVALAAVLESTSPNVVSS